MKQELARRSLSKLMNWDSERARREFAWLDLIARLKYDGYRGYFAGARFAECLLDWLQQFEEAERAVAYDFVRKHLVYLGSSEVQHLVELFYPETVRPLLADAVAAEFKMPRYMVWSREEVRATYKRLLRHALFMGISDGARLDTFRRANVGIVRNEQVVPTIEVDDRRWDSLVKDLRADIDDASARFRFIFLVDDFTGSGLTFLRREKETGRWDGKLVRFWESVRGRLGKQIDKDFTLVVHHYLASHHAASSIPKRAEEARKERGSDWFPNVLFHAGAVLAQDLPVAEDRLPGLFPIINRRYNPSIMTKSMRVGGDDGRFGFAGGGLPLVLEHNTPNNSIALLWAEADEVDEHPAMRPLFRRRQRHL